MISTYLGQAPSIFGLGAIETACYMYIKMKLFSNRLTGKYKVMLLLYILPLTSSFFS